MMPITCIFKRSNFAQRCNSRINMAFYDKFEKEDYYLTPDGFIVFTEVYHLKRGYCCQSNCRHCPWKKKDKKEEEKKPGTKD